MFCALCSPDSAKTFPSLNRFNVLFACANLVMCIRAGRTQEFVLA